MSTKSKKQPTNSQQFRAILDHIADGVVVQDVDAELVYLNPAATKMLGFADADEALKVGRAGILRAFDIFDDYGRPLPVEMLPGRQAIKGEAQPARVVRVQPHDAAPGCWRWAWVKASPIQSDDLKTEYVVSVFQEITQMKQTELGLKDANRRITKLLEQVLDSSKT
jgi:PAS domain-containing protein